MGRAIGGTAWFAASRARLGASTSCETKRRAGMIGAEGEGPGRWRAAASDVRPEASGPGRWERLFADLEAAMEEECRTELDAEIAERTRMAVGRLRLVDRLRA